MDGWQENPIYWYDAAPPAGFPETVRSVAENRASFLPGFVDSACAEVLANVRDRHTTAAVRSIKLGIEYRSRDFSTKAEMSMAPRAAALEERTTTAKDDAMRMELATAGGPAKHIHHQAYACWDSEETRHFYEDILGMPLIATVVSEDSRRNDGSGYCYTYFEIGDGDTLAFFEQMTLVHPRYFNARSAGHRHVTFEVEGDTTLQQFKRMLDAAGVANTLDNFGTSLSLRFNDPNGLILEFITKRRPLEFDKNSRSSAHSELQRWQLQRQNWWRRRRFLENSTTPRSAAT
jgi:glyoxylase I family protein